MAKIFGNDRSHWNGKSNYEIAYANGARFDIAKSSDGLDYLDQTFAPNFNGAKEKYQINGAYHYFRPAVSITSQLANLINGLKRVDFHKRAILAIDVEETDGLANSVTASRLKTFMKRLRAFYPDNPMMIYTSPYFWSLIGNGDPYWLQFGLWEANTGVKVPTPIPPWGDDWAIWQFSHTGYGPSWGAESKEIDVNIMAQWAWDLLTLPEPEPEPPEIIVLPEVISELTINGVRYTGNMTRDE